MKEGEKFCYNKTVTKYKPKSKYRCLIHDCGSDDIFKDKKTGEKICWKCGFYWNK